jgi:hypothetical protein
MVRTRLAPGGEAMLNNNGTPCNKDGLRSAAERMTMNSTERLPFGGSPSRGDGPAGSSGPSTSAGTTWGTITE